MTPDWLDWGALGLLAMVLAAIGLAGREWLKRQSERDDKRDEFLRGMIASDRAERDSQHQAWQELVREDIAAREALTRALNAVCESAREHERRAEERHKATIETIRAANGQAVQ